LEDIQDQKGVEVNLANKSRMTSQDFLVWSESWNASERYELVSGEIFAMSRERNRHSLVKLDIAVALRQSVNSSGLNCTVFGDGATVVVDDSTVYEPDVTVMCGGNVDLDAMTISNPCIIVEVLSPSTKGVDTGGKLAGYFSLKSVMHYLVVDSKKCQITVHKRNDKEISTRIVSSGLLSFEDPELTLKIDDMVTSLV